jgi:carbon monoxide dehydrogenase subunit G
MPGAQLTEVVDEHTYRGRIGVRLGPVALTFAGVVKLDEINERERTARVSAQGTDAKGRGGANAASLFRLEPAAGGCKVLVHTNLVLSGSVAQYGRGVGIIQATAAQLMNQFANNLKGSLAQEGAPDASASPPIAPSPPIDSQRSPPAPKPIAGFALMREVIRNRIGGWFRRQS